MNHNRVWKLLLNVIVIGTVCVFNACVGPIVEESAMQKSRVSVDVRAFYFEIEDMGTPTRTGMADAATRLSFAVFDSEDKLVESVIYQNSSETSFGLINLELYPGDYKLVAVAHNGEADAVINSSESVILPGDMFTDTFAQVQELKVESGKDCDFTMNLPRLTSAFVLRLTDTPPADVTEIEVTVNTTGSEPASLGLDPTTGLALLNWKFTRTIPVAEISKDTPIYFISKYSVTVITIKATAYDSDGKEIISHTLSNVSLVPNQRTIATGNFFKSAGSSSFSLSSEWNTDKEIEY